MENLYFPHDKPRPVQEELIETVSRQIEKGSHVIAHAPTGLGKTAATLAPALTYALKHDLKVFFLTSRHTQHQIAIDTLKKIKEKWKLKFIATSIVGKKSMCLQPGIANLSSSEFSEFCKALREESQCEYYTNTKNKEAKKTVTSKAALKILENRSPNHSEEVIEISMDKKLCPYEIAAYLAKDARVIVCDYYYVFNPLINESFFNKTNCDLEKCIIIIDEGHNLPGRMRELMSDNLSDRVLDLAIKEADKFNVDKTALLEIAAVLDTLKLNVDGEKRISKNQWYTPINKFKDYTTLILQLEQCADVVREKQKKSFIGSVASFLMAWQGPDEGFIRFIQKNYTSRGITYTLRYKCLDPSLITEPVLKKCHAAILMSGTLTPTFMYKDLLKFPANTVETELTSPFPVNNRLTVIVPRTTTKYSKRNEAQYKNIALYCCNILNEIPGNVAIFFPSYALKESVQTYLETITKKTVFSEVSGMTKQEKQEFLERFKKYKDTGAVLLGVASGSFGEGIDLPGDLLKGVIIVGLPLGRPDLETKELIEYYNKKFGKGWDYGYVLPAITKTLQNAGRCIRTEEDKGVIVFLDERYSWPMYFKCFPNDWNLKIKADPVPIIREFFEKS